MRDSISDITRILMHASITPTLAVMLRRQQTDGEWQ